MILSIIHHEYVKNIVNLRNYRLQKVIYIKTLLEFKLGRLLGYFLGLQEALKQSLRFYYGVIFYNYIFIIKLFIIKIT